MVVNGSTTIIWMDNKLYWNKLPFLTPVVAKYIPFLSCSKAFILSNQLFQQPQSYSSFFSITQNVKIRLSSRPLADHIRLHSFAATR